VIVLIDGLPVTIDVQATSVRHFGELTGATPARGGQHDCTLNRNAEYLLAVRAEEDDSSRLYTANMASILWSMAVPFLIGARSTVGTAKTAVETMTANALRSCIISVIVLDGVLVCTREVVKIL
jgi:hypothetical protein